MKYLPLSSDTSVFARAHLTTDPRRRRINRPSKPWKRTRARDEDEKEDDEEDDDDGEDDGVFRP
jgi:hypothetical protein